MKLNLKLKEHKDFKFFKETVFPYVMHWEGGEKLHKVSGDNGGWTKWGIAYNFWSHIFEDFEDFKNTTLEEAALFAFERFYFKIEADKVPQDCKLYYFDTSYNMGHKVAIKLMQKCIGVTDDGIIGPITRSKMNNLKEECLKELREKRYNSLAYRIPRLRKFLKGWMNRSKAVFLHKV